jgi:hypothetical protein
MHANLKKWGCAEIIRVISPLVAGSNPALGTFPINGISPGHFSLSLPEELEIVYVCARLTMKFGITHMSLMMTTKITIHYYQSSQYSFFYQCLCL